MLAVILTPLASVIAALGVVWLKQRYDKGNVQAKENTTAKATLAKVTDDRIERLFSEYDKLRSAYRSDMDDLRGQLRESNGRVELLEREVAEWRSGIRGVPGVWVAIPAHIWEMVRERLPDLPPTRFPGEAEIQGTSEG